MRISDWSSDVCSSDLTTTHCRSAANQRHTHKTAGTLLRMGKRETTMRKLLACIAIATLLAAAGCKKDAGPDAPAANPSADSGSSIQGAFRPPQAMGRATSGEGGCQSV